jgi:hypothetical protein
VGREPSPHGHRVEQVLVDDPQRAALIACAAAEQGAVSVAIGEERRRSGAVRVMSVWGATARHASMGGIGDEASAALRCAERTWAPRRGAVRCAADDDPRGPEAPHPFRYWSKARWRSGSVPVRGLLAASAPEEVEKPQSGDLAAGGTVEFDRVLADRPSVDGTDCHGRGPRAASSLGRFPRSLGRSRVTASLCGAGDTASPLVVLRPRGGSDSGCQWKVQVGWSAIGPNSGPSTPMSRNASARHRSPLSSPIIRPAPTSSSLRPTSKVAASKVVPTDRGVDRRYAALDALPAARSSVPLR